MVGGGGKGTNERIQVTSSFRFQKVISSMQELHNFFYYI